MAVPLVALVVALAGCGSVFEPGAPEQEGGYNLTVMARSELSGEIGSGYFEGRWTTWDPTIGVVVLGPEETGEPLAQLIINLGESRPLVFPYNDVPVPTRPDGKFHEVPVFSFDPGVNAQGTILRPEMVSFSTTDQRVGTGQELNGRLYELGEPAEFGCRNTISAGAAFEDYIEAEFCFNLQRVIVNPGDTSEVILLQGTFLAVNR